ncbi:MAG: baseplate J/gp47 family protein [Clostridia bacterium]|nr:baseplate J/gp47 family protein [Clostridia bacterium]
MSGKTETELYTDILDAMLSYAARRGLDTDEGSVAYDMLAPAALGMAALRMQLELQSDESFADTASLENLIRRAAERGIAYRAASPAVVRAAVTGGTLSLDDDYEDRRFLSGALAYYLSGTAADGSLLLTCETAGTAGNLGYGTLVYAGSLPGIAEAEIVGVETRGRDAETAQELRTRYFDSMKSAAFAGNKAAYREAAAAVAGVGGCKVERAPVDTDGCNVRLTVISDTYGVPDAAVLRAVETQIAAITPICHICAVQAVQTAPVSVSATVAPEDGYAMDTILQNAESALRERLHAAAGAFAQNGSTVVKRSDLFLALLAAEGVADVAQLRVDIDGEPDIFAYAFDGRAIPVLDALTLSEVAQ